MFWLPLALAALFCAWGVVRTRDASPWRRWWIRVPVVTVAAMVVSWSFARGGTDLFPFDDSYISLAAARTFAEHGQIAVVKNRLLAGVTSPLHIVLTGALGLLLGVESAARWISWIAFVMSALGAGFLAERVARDARAFAWGAAFALFAGPTLYDVGSAMETAPFTALVVWTLLAFEDVSTRRRGIIAGVLLGLTMLTRPEGALLAVAIFAVPLGRVAWTRDREAARAWLVPAIVACAVFAPYVVANLALTGHVLSPTVSAKAVFFRSGRLDWPNPVRLGDPLRVFLVGAELFAVAGLAGLAFTRRRAELLFLMLFYASYLMRFDVALRHYRARYQHPLWILAAVGAAALIVWIAKRRDGKTAARAVAAVAGIALMLATLQTARVYRVYFRQDLGSTREFLMPMVRAVQDAMPKGFTVASHDVGALIYFSDRYVLDLVGLTDERIAKQLRESDPSTAALGAVMATKKPYLLVVLRDWEQDFLQLTKFAPPGMYTLAWSSPAPNAATGAVYDIYRVRHNIVGLSPGAAAQMPPALAPSPVESP
ncbi:MAG: glycosyltransferase family 39 protein [Deltaproteobacteria bacterium]|nr:glycosyltransferase family 39 protein [Deltaproteobacteria bacterium]